MYKPELAIWYKGCPYSVQDLGQIFLWDSWLYKQFELKKVMNPCGIEWFINEDLE